MTKFKEFLDPKDLMSFNRLEKYISFQDFQDFQEIILIGSDTKKLNINFKKYFMSKVDYVEFKHIKDNLFHKMITNEEYVKNRNKYIIIDLFDIKDYKDIRDEFQFKRDNIPDKKLKIILFLNKNQYESFKIKAYDFFSFNNFAYLFTDNSYSHVSTYDTSKLKKIIKEYKKVKNTLNERSHISYLDKIAMLAYEYSQFNVSLDYLQQSLKIARKIKNKFFQANILGNIGLMYQGLSQYEKALKYYEDSLKIKKEINDIKGEAYTLGNIGTVYQDLSQYEKALKYYEDSLKIKKEINDIKGEAYTLGNIGKLHKAMKNEELALRYEKSSLEILKALGLDKKNI